MSTSILYHGFGIIGYRYQKTDYKGGQVFFHIEQPRDKLRCPLCNARDVILRGSIARRFRTIPIGEKPIWIVLDVQRVFCPECQVVRQVKIQFADPKKRYTRQFERYVLGLSHFMTIKDIANLLQTSWDTVKDIQMEKLQKQFSKPPLKDLERIAIDEISIGKNHKYLTIVLDLESGAVVHVGDGKGSEALDPFFKRLKYSKADIKAVAIDMSPAYTAAVIENLPSAKIVYDHFHLVKLFNDKLSDLRRQLYNECEVLEQKVVMKGTRWLLLKNEKNLNPERNEKERLEKALALNKPLATAYYLKEDFKQLWNKDDKEEAKDFLSFWIKKAMASGIGVLQKFARTVQGHSFGILAYFDHPISTGPLEGVNNKIKTLVKQAYGYRNMDFFKLKIKALHLSKYALIG